MICKLFLEECGPHCSTLCWWIPIQMMLSSTHLITISRGATLDILFDICEWYWAPSYMLWTMWVWTRSLITNFCVISNQQDHFIKFELLLYTWFILCCILCWLSIWCCKERMIFFLDDFCANQSSIYVQLDLHKHPWLPVVYIVSLHSAKLWKITNS